MMDYHLVYSSFGSVLLVMVVTSYGAPTRGGDFDFFVLLQDWEFDYLQQKSPNHLGSPTLPPEGRH